MYGKVMIGDKEVGLLANAASPYIYKQVFHEDFLAAVQADTPDPDIFQKMGFIMAMQAENQNMADLMKLNIDSFYEWLVQFDAMDVIFATEDISNIYLKQTVGTSSPKKEAE